MPRSCRIVVLISGTGSNLGAMIEATRSRRVAGEIVGVVSNRADALGLTLAESAGIASAVVPHRDFPDRESYDTALGTRIDQFAPDLIVLAGFMRILTSGFVAAYQGRMLNIHPSLLPAFKGLQTHQRALAAGATEHGASVHWVTPDLDGGPVILQARLSVAPTHTSDTLAADVLALEHQIYPIVVGWFCDGRLSLGEGAVVFDGRRLEQPLLFEPPKAS
ncbi:MAG: phosphoribosylglycinamide formyltransferase [Thiotrichales bacterium]